MGAADHKTLLIACGALAREVLDLKEQNGWDAYDVVCLPATLHNRPNLIPDRMREKIRESKPHYDRILCLFSDCGTGGLLQQVLDEEGVEGIGGAHCYEMFTGHAAFADMASDNIRAFYLTDFLVKNFDTLIWKGLGLDRMPELLPMYFGNYTTLTYLAQIEDPDLCEKARGLAERLGLTFELRHTGYGYYADFLTDKEKSMATHAPDMPGVSR